VTFHLLDIFSKIGIMNGHNLELAVNEFESKLFLPSCYSPRWIELAFGIVREDLEEKLVWEYRESIRVFTFRTWGVFQDSATLLGSFKASAVLPQGLRILLPSTSGNLVNLGLGRS
jgi:hypothetical protein